MRQSRNIGKIWFSKFSPIIFSNWISKIQIQIQLNIIATRELLGHLRHNQKIHLFEIAVSSQQPGLSEIQFMTFFIVSLKVIITTILLSAGYEKLESLERKIRKVYDICNISIIFH